MRSAAPITTQKWLNWLLATGGTASGVRVGSAAAAAIYANGTGGWPDAPRACQLSPRQFPNGGVLRSLLPMLPPRSNCSCDATGGAGGGRASAGGGVREIGRRCAQRRRILLESLSAAHLNFALSAAEKLCLAKALGLWLLSDGHRDGFGTVASAAVAAALHTLPAGATELAADEGRVSARVVASGRGAGRAQRGG